MVVMETMASLAVQDFRVTPGLQGHQALQETPDHRYVQWVGHVVLATELL